MDPEVWKHLPDHEDILRLILSRISWDTNLHLRSVSKAFYTLLSEPSVFTWSSMLTDASFYTDHSRLKWVAGDIDSENQVEQIRADAVCLFSSSQSVTYGMVNFRLHRWCKLPPLGDLPFGNLNDFTVTGVAEGLLLLERTMSRRRYVDDPLVDMYELDRLLFNPLTRGFIKLPVVPKIKDNSGRLPSRLRMIMAVEKELVTVVAVAFYSQVQHEFPRILIWRQGRDDWELSKARHPPTTILPVDSTMFVDGRVTNAVFVGAELFLHLETEKDENPGARVFSYGSRACAIDPELIWGCDDKRDVTIYVFQHKGSLKRLELHVQIEVSRTQIRSSGCLVKLYTFDSSNRSWQEEEITLMPRFIQKWVFESSRVVGVLGDTLCIRNQHNRSVFILYNFLSKQWCRCYAKELVRALYHTNFLWSPKPYDSWNKTPSVR